MNGLALCAGLAGLDLGLSLVVPDYRAVVYVEREAFVAARLVARMDEGILAAAPIWDDLATFDGRQWRGHVDCVTAGFPCQPWSAAGRGAGVSDDRWIWPDIRERVREVEPRLVYLENVPPLVSRGGLALVLGDLAGLGFDAEWDLFAAADVGASHRRERLFILAYRRGCRLPFFRPREVHRRRDAPRHHAHGCRAALAGDCGNPESVGDEGADGARAVSGRSVAHSRGARLPYAEYRGQPAASLGEQLARTATAECRSASVGDAGCPKWGSHTSERRTRDARGDGEREAAGRSWDPSATVGDAPRRGCGELRRSFGVSSWRLVDVPDATLADAGGDAVRIEPERDQRSRRGERAAERADAIARADVPLFPPAPRDIHGWRGVLGVRPELAPALAMEDAARPREHGSVWSDRGRRRGAAQAGHETSTGEGEVERELRRVVDGMADRVDRLRACGNGVVPLAAAYAFVTLAIRAGLWDSEDFRG